MNPLTLSVQYFTGNATFSLASELAAPDLLLLTQTFGQKFTLTDSSL